MCTVSKVGSKVMCIVLEAQPEGQSYMATIQLDKRSVDVLTAQFLISVVL